MFTEYSRKKVLSEFSPTAMKIINKLLTSPTSSLAILRYTYIYIMSRTDYIQYVLLNMPKCYC